jgi:hypothetical protein
MAAPRQLPRIRTAEEPRDGAADSSSAPSGFVSTTDGNSRPASGVWKCPFGRESFAGKTGLGTEFLLDA